MRRLTVVLIVLGLGAIFVSSIALARNPIRTDFFDVYTSATGTRLDDLPSNASHCGVCHFDFDGGGPRNPYGAAVEVAINSGSFPNREAAIASLDTLDSDGDGYANGVEITSLLFTNTPTFPGLTSSDTSSITNVTISEVSPYLTPMGSSDTIPPAVAVLSPNGSESWDANDTQPVTWTATDSNGVSHVDIYFSDDGGVSYRPIARNEANDGTFSWFVPNRPGSNSRIRVVAQDNAGNKGSDASDAVFDVNALPAGYIPTTLRDVDLPGTQPLTGTELEDPDVNCVTCHGGYDTAAEPYHNWKGSMMAQAQRDPLYLACLAIVEQDAPSVGDLCIRCHSPGGWLEGRSVDTGAGLLNAKDREGVQCDFCHRLVDPIYNASTSPMEDIAILDSLTAVPTSYGSGKFVTDPGTNRRGPYDDAVASHAFLQSSFMRSSNMCGTCHNVSNPAFVYDGTPGKYSPNGFDAPHPDGNPFNMFPIERTYSEYTQSAYANGGVYQPQFAGNLPTGIIENCQDCHMVDVTGKGCNVGGAPNRTDLGLHDLTGANHFVPDVLPAMWPGEVDSLRLQDGKNRAISMLGLAASLALAPGQVGDRPKLTVTVTNETAHKLPSGYPEGRRIWLNVRVYNSSDSLIYESGAYDASTGVLTHDEDAKIYEIKPGLSTRLAPALGLTAGPSFHFVLNDTIYYDNRIPPRGFTNTNFEAIHSQPVGYSYADSQYWDETEYILPYGAAYAEVKLYYQTTSKEYVEFLRDENVTNSAGDDLYNAWVAQGKAPPVTMAEDTVAFTIDPTVAGGTPMLQTGLESNRPNPFNATTEIRYTLARRQYVRIEVFDVRGRKVRTLIDEVRPAGAQHVIWKGYNDYGEASASGVYFVRMISEGKRWNTKAVLVK